MTTMHSKSPSSVNQRQNGASMGQSRMPSGATIGFKDVSNTSSNNSSGVHCAPKTTHLKSPGKSFQPMMLSSNSGKQTRSNKM